MKVKDLQIEGFGVWTGLSVDSLPDGMTVFYGPNEAGKTTLMQFLRAMFYGFTPERRSRYLPPVHGGKPGGAMRVTGPGGGYEIARRAQLNDPGVIGQLTVTSSDGLVQGQHRLAMLLGQVDESIFTNVFAIGLRELQELSTLDDTAAADELYKLSSGLDRVSLVDVMRQLRGARGQIVGPTPEIGQMQLLIQKREKLRDEQDQLIARGKRWGELAAQKKSHQTEIDELKQRKEQWELESKIIETALQVRDPWMNRDRLRTNLSSLHARIELPDDSGQKLRDLQTQLDERQAKLNEVKQQRQAVRTRAMALPVRKSILQLSSKIEAASEQGPWITALQKQIARLSSEVSQTREQLMEDAKRLGVSESDQDALLADKRLANLPDLSSQAITQLATPAREVRVHSVRVKQARVQSENDKKEAQRLKDEIDEFLGAREQTDLHESLQLQTDRLTQLRSQEQVEEKLRKLQKHRKELQEEADDLKAEDVLPMERFLVLAIPFLFGAVMIVIGFATWMNTGIFGFRSDSAYNPAARGLLFMFIGVMALIFWYMWKSFTERGTGDDVINCEEQLAQLVSQIRKTETERDELARLLPAFSGTVEQQMREYEHELQLHETMLPVHHNYQAALQRYQAARRRGKTSSQSLKTAKAQWKKTLQQLGLAESLSPKSIRIMAEGYETLLQTRRRLKTQQDELDQRKLELASITQRVDALARQTAAALKEVSEDAAERRNRKALRDERSGKEEKSRESNRDAGAREKKIDPAMMLNRDAVAASETDSGENAVAKLQDLAGMLAEQQAYIQQRRQLKEEDATLAKHQKGIQRSIDRIILTRQALLAELGVENQQQLEQHLDTKREHFKLVSQIDELEDRVKAIIGGNCPFDAVAKQLDNASSNELDKRWDGLSERIKQAELRISQLLQRQGETTQEMKSLAAERRLAELKLELAVLDKQLQAAANHWQTLAATTTMLEKVCEVYETERQPETLREASSFLKKLTEDKYTRVWTPLGKNALRIDNQQGQSLPLEVLSRGTREAVFIALRLSLAAAYARRGVTLPLVLDDVLVNFDTVRARQAARVLQEFSELGSQVIMFTCHEHIMRMFHDIGVQVRVLPTQGTPGEAKIYMPEERPVRLAPIFTPKIEIPEPVVELPIIEPVIVEPKIETVYVPEPVVVAPVIMDHPLPPTPEPIVELIRVEIPKKVKPPVVHVDPIPEIDHLWYELDPMQAIWHDGEEIATQDPESIPENNDDSSVDSWWTHA